MARKEKPAEEGAPLWMCTYGDLMSLLLCFFIMLFAISIIAEVRFQAVADTLTQDFTGFQGTSTTKAPQPRTTPTPEESAAKNRRISELVGGQPMPSPVGQSPEVLAMLRTGTTIRNGVILFDTGSYQLNEEAKLALREAEPELRGSPQKIMIKGYTTPAERSNTNQLSADLAFFRAQQVVNFLVSLGIPQGRFEIVDAPSEFPRLNLLPPGTPPELAGATVEIVLLNQTRSP